MLWWADISGVTVKPILVLLAYCTQEQSTPTVISIPPLVGTFQLNPRSAGDLASTNGSSEDGYNLRLMRAYWAIYVHLCNHGFVLFL